jgi:hypothetical protein
MPRLTLGDVLNEFSGPEIAKALVRAGLPGGGTKIYRVELLRSAAVRQGMPATEALEFFSSEALRRVGLRFGVRATQKADLIRGLCESIAAPVLHQQAGRLDTMDSLRQYVQSLSGARRRLASESDAEVFLASALADRFADVRTQVSVPGHFGHRIDIDIANGRFGVEVKFAPALIESSSEAYRLLGQAFYYDRRRYAGRLLVVVVGPEMFGSHPIIGELFDLLSALGVAAFYLAVD